MFASVARAPGATSPSRSPAPSWGQLRGARGAGSGPARARGAPRSQPSDACPPLPRVNP